MARIEYSTDIGRHTFDEQLELARQSEQFFKTAKDAKQFPITLENVRWVYEKHPEWINIVYYNKKVIGGAFAFPCTKNEMNDFLLGNISEAELFVRIKKSFDYSKSAALYVSSIFISPRYRKKGLGHLVVQKLHKLLEKKARKKLVVFYEDFATKKRNSAKEGDWFLATTQD